jgi:predicted nucleic acid-binding protein
MENKIFLDTNIVLDLIIPYRKYSNISNIVLEKLAKNGYEFYLSEDIISTTYYIAKNHKEETLRFFQGALKFWNIVPFGEKIIKASLEFSLKNSCDLEDTLQCFCAKENGCILLTNDKKFIDCGIKVVNYKDFLGE